MATNVVYCSKQFYMSGEEGNQMTCALDFSIDMNKIKTFDQIKNLSSVKKVLAKYNYSDETKKKTPLEC
jgi:hypothetical protein